MTYYHSKKQENTGIGVGAATYGVGGHETAIIYN